MSSTGQGASSSTSSPGSNVRLILDALANYATITGIDLSSNPFAAAIEQADSPEDILHLLQERANDFGEVGDGNQRLTGILNPAVRVLHAFSGVLGDAGGMVPFPPTSALFVGIDTLLATASKDSTRETSSYYALIELFECLGNFIKRLEIYTTIPPSSLMTELIVRIMVQLLSVLALATKKVKEGRFRKVRNKLLGEREIEDALQRLDRLTQEEVRLAVAQTLGVVHGLVDDVRVLVDDVRRLVEDNRASDSRASADFTRQDLDNLRMEMNSMKHTQLRRDIQHWLSPPDPSTNHNAFWSARHQGTAAWLFENEEFIRWKTTGSLLWIHGKPGSGKSTLLSAIVEDIRGMWEVGSASMAYYYFDFHDVKKQDRYGLLSSLLFQLSAEGKTYNEILSELYQDNADGTTMPTYGALIRCLEDILRLPGQAPIFIIVDALDECPNISGRPLSAREEVLELMEELVDLKLPGLHLCVASRPEIDIRMVLKPLTHFQISLHDDSGQKEDIIAYIKAVVHSDRMMRRLKKEDQTLVVDKLSQKADGSYRWVVCQVDALRYSLPISIRRVIGDLPPSLDETYEKALLGINKAKREYALQLYQCIAVSIRPLRVEELAETLAIRFDEAVSPMFDAAWRPKNAEEAVMSTCSSLIATVDRGGQQVAQFSHFSVKEYLTSERLAAAEERLSYYHIIPEPAHTILAHASLSILLHLDDKIDRDTMIYFPLAPYAARYWTYHAQFRNVSSHVKEDMKCLFDSAKPHFAAWVWLFDIDRYWTESMPTMHPTQPEAVPLYYASLCGFVGLVEHLLDAHPQDVNARGGHHVTSLNAALDKRHVKVAQLLLQHGADANTPDGQSRTPLHIAAEHGDTEVIRSLIDHGADTNAKDSDKSIPLSLASRRGRGAAALLLLEDGADVGHQDSVGQTPIHEALDNGHVNIARLLLDRGADAGAQGRSLRTPLHLAAGLGELSLSQLLLERGAGVDVRDEMDWTPLHFASKHGDPKILRFLISQGANPDARNKDQETPLFLASREGKLEAARLLSEHSTDIDSQDSLGRTPLYVTAENGHYDIVHLLLDQGADVDAPEENLRTPLHLAADKGKFKVATLLLEYGAEVDARDEMDQTPLHFAAQQGYLELVWLLLENHADVLALNREDHTFLDVAWKSGHKEIVDVNARYEGGQTALHIAAQHGDTELMSWLIHRKLNPILPNVEDDDQETPLFPASRNGKLDATRLLLDEKAEVKHRDWQKMTALHGASENGHHEVAQLLLERNAEVDAKHKNAWTPLHLASRAGQDNVTKVLLDHNAIVNVKNDSNWTPLHMASQEGHSEVVRLLLGHGADVNIQNNADDTALHLAAFYAHLEVAKVLLDQGANPEIKNKKGEIPATLKSKGGKTLLELAQERGDSGDDSMVVILKLAALRGDKLGELPVGEPVGERQVGEEQARTRMKIPE